MTNVNNGIGWKVAIGLFGVLAGTLGGSGYAYVQINKVDEKSARERAVIKQELSEELKEHRTLLREVDRKLARIEGLLAKGDN